MICYVFKPRRRVDGKLHESRFYSGKLRMDWEPGLPRVIALHTSERREAERRLTEERIIREKQHYGGMPPSEQLQAAERPYPELLELFLSDLRAEGRAGGTIKKYRHMLVLAKRCGWQRIADVTQRSFIDWRKGSELAPRTLNALLKDTGTFFRWMKRQRMVTENPLEFVPMVDTRRLEKFRRAFTQDELKRLFTTAPHERAVVYMTAYYTGLRRNELYQVTVEDLVLDSPAPGIRVRASTAKHPKESYQRLPPELVEALRSILPENPSPSHRVFAGLIPRIPRFKKDLTAAGIPFLDARGATRGSSLAASHAWDALGGCRSVAIRD